MNKLIYDVKRKALNIFFHFDRYLLLFVFFLIVTLPSVFLNVSLDASHELKENRTLEPFPRASLFYFQKLEKWYLDHFGGRADLIYLGARIQMNTLGIPANRQVLVGRDQWLFYDQHYKSGRSYFSDYRGLDHWTPQQLETIKGNLKETNRHLKRCGINFYLVFAPDKQTIYSDKMPFEKRSTGHSKLDYLIKYLEQESDLKILDLRKTLSNARQIESHPLYYKTDTHWNSLGAFYAAQAMLYMMRLDGLEINQLRRDEWTVKAEPFDGGDIALSMLSLPKYFSDEKLEMKRINISSEKKTMNMLLYGDSFADAMTDFLDGVMGEIALVKRVSVDGKDIEKHKPEVVVIEVLERLLAGLLTAPTGLGACH